MSLLFHRLYSYFYLFLCIASTWIILSATPSLQLLEGMFRQVDSQILLLHAIGGILYIFKGIEGFFIKEKTKEINNIFFILPFLIAVLSFISAFFNNNFYTTLLGSYQIGQGAFWYFNFAILILFFSTLVKNYKLRLFFFLNIILLTTVVSIFTIFPYWKGINITFFYFTDYLCYFGIISFILFTTVIKNKLATLVAYCFLGWFLSLLDNRAAIGLWAIVFLVYVGYELLSISKNNFLLKKIKNILFSNLALSLSVFIISILILLSAVIFWRGEGALPNNIADSPIASLVVRGKLIEIIFLDFLNFKNLLVGEGWGRISDLLHVQMDAWQFDQLTVGFNLHFHTHNEMFEHFFSLGFFGLMLFLFLIFYTFKTSNSISIYNKLGWLLFFYVSCFWFFWAGTLPVLALAIATLTYTEKHKLKLNANLINKIVDKHNFFISFSFLLIGGLLFYGSYLTYSYSKEYKKMSYEALAAFSKNQNLTDINCNNYYNDIKGGETISRFIGTFPRYLAINEIEYNETYVKILETLQCLSEELIFNSKASVDLLSASILLDSKLFFSNSDLVKVLVKDEKKYENLKRKVFELVEVAPKRGDIIMPFIAISLKKNKINVVNELCNIRDIRGIEGYCNLIFAYQKLNSKYPSNSDIKMSIDHIKKAVEKGILEEKVYGWWFFEDLARNVSGYDMRGGFPVSPDIIYYISTEEALRLLEIIERFEN